LAFVEGSSRTGPKLVTRGNDQHRANELARVLTPIAGKPAADIAQLGSYFREKGLCFDDLNFNKFFTHG
jgi:hypothetical protein